MTDQAAGLRIEKLAPPHSVDAFACGAPALDRFLIRHALQAQRAGSSTTYVARHNETIVGYHSLTVGQVAHGQAAERLRKGMPRHPVPIMLLARLAVASAWQGQGIGSELLADALRRTVQAADIAGIRAMVVHAKDDAARRFYEHFDFLPSPTDPYHMYLLLKDIHRLIAGGG